jgi:ATP-dependent RNA helicase SUPV3L1/SUV3
MTRNSDDLQFGSIKRVTVQTLRFTQDLWLTRVRKRRNLGALKTLGDDPWCGPLTDMGRPVKLLWDVCRIPDFRGIGLGERH